MIDSLQREIELVDAQLIMVHKDLANRNSQTYFLSIDTDIIKINLLLLPYDLKIHFFIEIILFIRSFP
jgi:hypothetical protein